MYVQERDNIRQHKGVVVRYVRANDGRSNRPHEPTNKST